MTATTAVTDFPVVSQAVVLRRPKPLRMLWVTAVWGACFVAIELGLRDAPVLWFAALRAVVAGLALLAAAGIQPLLILLPAWCLHGEAVSRRTAVRWWSASPVQHWARCLGAAAAGRSCR